MKQRKAAGNPARGTTGNDMDTVATMSALWSKLPENDKAALDVITGRFELDFDEDDPDAQDNINAACHVMRRLIAA